MRSKILRVVWKFRTEGEKKRREKIEGWDWLDRDDFGEMSGGARKLDLNCLICRYDKLFE